LKFERQSATYRYFSNRTAVRVSEDDLDALAVSQDDHGRSDHESLLENPPFTLDLSIGRPHGPIEIAVDLIRHRPEFLLVAQNEEAPAAMERTEMFQRTLLAKACHWKTLQFSGITTVAPELLSIQVATSLLACASEWSYRPLISR
jgi:hypothetical protein